MSENGAVEGSDVYDPAAHRRTPAREEDGTGLAREKHPVATLRVFTAPDAAEWLLYGGVRGGRQGRGWIELFYEGLLPGEGEIVFGFWRLRVEGTGELEQLAHQLGKQVRNTLKAGKEEKFTVTRISLEAMAVSVRE